MFGAAVIKGESTPDVVATKMGRGGMETTSTSRERMPARQILAPPSMSCGLLMALDAMAAQMIFTMDLSSLWRPKTRGSPITWVTLPRRPPDAVIWLCS